MWIFFGFNWKPVERENDRKQERQPFYFYFFLSFSFPRNFIFETTHTIVTWLLLSSSQFNFSLSSLPSHPPSVSGFSRLVWSGSVYPDLPLLQFIHFFISLIYCISLISLFYLNFKSFMPSFFRGPLLIFVLLLSFSCNLLLASCFGSIFIKILSFIISYDYLLSSDLRLIMTVLLFKFSMFFPIQLFPWRIIVSCFSFFSVISLMDLYFMSFHAF